MDIEQVAQLAKFYAAGTPSDEEFRSLKERIDVASDGAHPAPKEWRTSEEIRSSGLTHDPDTARDTFNQRIEMDSEKSDLSDGLRALESSIRISAGDRALMRGGISRTLVLFFFAGLIALGATFAWHYHGNDTKEMVSRWVLPVDRSMPGRSRPRPLQPLLLLSWCSMNLLHPISPPLEAAQRSPVSSKNRGTPISLRSRESSRTLDRKHHHRLHIRARNRPHCRKRGRQPLRVGCFAKSSMARQSWKDRMASGG